MHLLLKEVNIFTRMNLFTLNTLPVGRLPVVQCNLFMIFQSTKALRETPKELND